MDNEQEKAETRSNANIIPTPHLDQLNSFGERFHERIVEFGKVYDDVTAETQQLLLEWVLSNTEWHFHYDTPYRRRLMAVMQNDDDTYTVVAVKVADEDVEWLRNGGMELTDYVKTIANKVEFTLFSQSASRGIKNVLNDGGVTTGYGTKSTDIQTIFYEAAMGREVGSTGIQIRDFDPDTHTAFKSSVIYNLLDAASTKTTLYLAALRDPVHEVEFDELDSDYWENDMNPPEDLSSIFTDHPDVTNPYDWDQGDRIYVDSDVTDDLHPLVDMGSLEYQQILAQQSQQIGLRKIVSTNKTASIILKNIQEEFAELWIKDHGIPEDFALGYLDDHEYTNEELAVFMERLELYKKKVFEKRPDLIGTLSERDIINLSQIIAFDENMNKRLSLRRKVLDWDDPLTLVAAEVVMALYNDLPARKVDMAHVVKSLYGKLPQVLEQSMGKLLGSDAFPAISTSDEAIISKYVSPHLQLTRGSYEIDEREKPRSMREWVLSITQWEVHEDTRGWYLAARYDDQGATLYVELRINHNPDTTDIIPSDYVKNHIDNVTIVHFSQKAIMNLQKKEMNDDTVSIPRLHLAVNPVNPDDKAEIGGESGIVEYISNI